MGEMAVGLVTHYFPHVRAAAVSLTQPLRIGDRIHVVGRTTDVVMTVDRLQVDHADVREARAGDDVAVHVAERVREHDEVRKVEG